MNLRRPAAATALLATAAACQIIVGIGDDHFTVAPIADAGAEDPDAGAPAVDLCAHARPPPPPGPSDAAATKPYVFVVDDFDVTGKTDAGVAAGYDLDKACSCFDGGSTAHDAAPSCASPGAASICDERDGIDDGFAALRRQLSVFGSAADFEARERDQINCGKHAVVFILRDYNGTANDEEVLLGPIRSAGIRETLDGAPGVPGPGCTQGAGEGGTFGPKRDGTDVWSYPKGTLQSSSTIEDPIPIVMVSGYVTDFRLVVSYDDDQHKLPLAFAGSTVSLGTPIITARLVPLDEANVVIGLGADGNPVSTPHAFAMVEGVLGGRAKADEIVTAAGRMSFARAPDGTDILGCNSPIFPALREIMCAAVDIPSLGRNDFTARPCDAFSVAFQFRAGPAHMRGEYTEPDPDPSACPADFGRCP